MNSSDSLQLIDKSIHTEGQAANTDSIPDFPHNQFLQMSHFRKHSSILWLTNAEAQYKITIYIILLYKITI